MPTGVYVRTEEYREIMKKAMQGRIFTEIWKQRMKDNHKGMTGKHFSEEHKIKIGLKSKGNKYACKFGQGLWDNAEYARKWYREYYSKNIEKLRKYQRDRIKNLRHKEGISKKYNDGNGISYTKEYKKLQRQRRKAFFKGGGKLDLSTIQQVYEENIKKYGTLTCYLCELPIPFGKDHLEHKVPLSRGGNNDKTNLDIACQKCNCKKHIKTETEYRKEIYDHV